MRWVVRREPGDKAGGEEGRHDAAVHAEEATRLRGWRSEARDLQPHLRREPRDRGVRATETERSPTAAASVL
jgi:hypothetical protein